MGMGEAPHYRSADPISSPLRMPLDRRRRSTQLGRSTSGIRQITESRDRNSELQ